MSSIYGRLGFNSSDPNTEERVSNYTPNVVNGLELVPALLKPWQQEDVATSNTGGYFVNPVASIAHVIWNTSNSFLQLEGTISNYDTPTIAANMNAAAGDANTISYSTASSYLYITNRQSNVVDVETDMTTPHYKTATGVGKMLSYITFQSDGVQNNSPIMGSFISITLANTLNDLSNTFINVNNIFANTINVDNTDPENPTYNSNISLVYSELMYNTIHQIANVFSYYPQQDTQFFLNSQSVVSDFSKVSPFSNIGETESYLLNNFIGTDKIKSRINS